MSTIPIKIEPVEGEEGTWRIYLSGQAYLDCREGGTGACCSAVTAVLPNAPRSCGAPPSRAAP
jgi:hypothetical protein